MPIKKNYKNIKDVIREKMPQAGSVSVGFYAGVKYRNGEDVVTVAIKNEYGSFTNTERPYFRQATIRFNNNIEGLLVRLSNNDKLHENNFYDYVGTYYKKVIQDSIKTFNVIDTGLLRKSVTYRIKEND